MKQLLKKLDDVLPSALLILGGIVASAGIGLIYVPAGIIAAGAMMMGLGVLLIRGGGDAS